MAGCRCLPGCFFLPELLFPGIGWPWPHYPQPLPTKGGSIATSINAELKDAKKTLPKALTVGTVAVAIIYMLYYLGISGVLSNDQVIAAGDDAPVKVLAIIFGKLGGTFLTVFVVISCLGTLNGLIMGSARGMYSIASRGIGPKVDFFKKVNKKTNSTINSALLGFILSAFWLGVWYGNFAGWWGGFIDISELPIAFLYVIYISIYVWVMKNFDDLGFMGRVMAPFLAFAGLAAWGGGYLGTKLMQKKMHPQTVKKLLGGVLLLLGVKLLWSMV